MYLLKIKYQIVTDMPGRLRESTGRKHSARRQLGAPKARSGKTALSASSSKPRAAPQAGCRERAGGPWDGGLGTQMAATGVGTPELS
ncbi:MAG: hypothetical protein BJ554DRAFT_1810 [Olpidium bornovanus]|uniref:Uncharacterized protein n=1 Tax=Olpidium bornovanus TaxID=278681 RepID=A0A8H8DHE2_9FUNG|nr:MAG: hypothetical protein BJ554DRAFT_1810 [Olpidium bornovanus]